MGQPGTEPSMEDILASIKRIIAEDAEAAPQRPTRSRRGPVAVPDPEPVAEPAAPIAVETDAPEDDGGADPAPPVVTPFAAALAAASERHAPSPPATPIEEPSDVLELTSPLPEPRDPILSNAAEEASRSAFALLGQLQVRAEAGQPNTLDGLLADLLKPMLREWLDRELPAMVERIVTAEVKRLSGG